MKTVEPHVKNYVDTKVKRDLDAAEVRFDAKIDKSIAKARHEFGLEIKGYMLDLRKGFREEIKMGFEGAEARMRDVAREVIREEVPGIVRREIMAVMVN